MGRPLSATPSAAAIRGRRHRARQQEGHRAYFVEMHEDGLTQLIAKGFLRDGDDEDDAAVGRAIAACIAFHLELKEPNDESFKRVRLNPLGPM